MASSTQSFTPHNVHVQALEYAEALTQVLQLLPEAEVLVQVSDT